MKKSDAQYLRKMANITATCGTPDKAFIMRNVPPAKRKEWRWRASSPALIEIMGTDNLGDWIWNHTEEEAVEAYRAAADLLGDWL